MKSAPGKSWSRTKWQTTGMPGSGWDGISFVACIKSMALLWEPWMIPVGDWSAEEQGHTHWSPHHPWH